MASKKRVDAALARQRRARLLLAGLGVVLLGLSAIQVPKLLNHAKPAAAATASSATTTTTATAAVAPAAAPATALVVSVSTTPSSLTKFTRFAAKDPFAAPGSPASAPTSAPALATPPAATAPAAPAATKASPAARPAKPGASAAKIAKSSSAPTSTGAATPSATPAKPAGRPGALLAIDGKRHGYAEGDQLPVRNPVMRLVQLMKQAVVIGLIGGSLPDGSTTLKLQAGQRLVLVNTTDGSRYVLRYVGPARVPAAKRA